MAGDDRPILPRRPERGLARVAVFTLDTAGRVASWPATAARMFGHTAHEVAGRDVCEVLLTGAAARQLMRQGLAEVAAGKLWTATLGMTFASGGGLAAIECEPLPEPQGAGVLVIAQPASPRAGRDLLSEAAARIGTTLDLTRTAREVADVVVPAFADAAAIFVSERLLAADEPGSYGAGPGAVVRRLAARMTGQSASFTDRLLRPNEVLVFGADSPSLSAMTSGSPVPFNHLDIGTAERIARRPGGAEITSDYASFLAVPLRARGVVLGSATFARLAGAPAFSSADIALAGELAARAAVCIDNARLYGRERRTASALQQSMLPSESPVAAGLEVAHRYLAVGDSVIGGDWHDIVLLPGGRVAVIVGDAMGHGPEAAAVMVQLRTAAHTLADLELPPAEVLRRLDRMVERLPDAPFATCVAALIDPPQRFCVVARAGHPPPVLAGPDGAVEVLDVPTGLPLGIGGDSFQATRFSLPPGAVLALYTDGLVESRNRSIDDGLAALRDVLSTALAQPDSSLDGTCELVTQALRQRGEDDITLVLARIRP